MKRGKPLKRTGGLKRSRLKRTGKIKPVNRARKKKRREECFGPQAKLAMTKPCCNCGLEPTDEYPTLPHHWPTVANGGKDENTSPLCRHCHVPIFHSQCGSAEAFLKLTGTDVIKEARLLKEQLKEAS